MDYFIVFLMRSRYILPIITSVAILVLGIIVALIKVKQTKILGLSVIFTGIGAVISSVENFFFYYMGAATAARLNVAATYMALIFTLASYFCICVYIHHNYEKKFYVPMLVIPVVGRFLTIGVNRLASMLGSRYMDYATVSFRTTLINNLSSMIINVTLLIILYSIFSAKTKTEKYIPHYHIICLITLIWNVINHGYMVFYSFIMLSEITVIGFELPSFIDAVIQKTYLLVTVFAALDALIGLVFPVYLLIRVLKASSTAKIESAPEI